MSTQDLHRKEYFASSVLCVVVAALMVGVALKTPPAPIRYLFLATPYVLLCPFGGRFVVYTRRPLCQETERMTRDKPCFNICEARSKGRQCSGV